MPKKTATGSNSDQATYTKPELRDHLKKKIMAEDKGGNPGQWSARKAQLLAREYETQGGGYKRPPNASQKSLKGWTEEQWQTADGKTARRPGGTTRYLPEKAWDQLSDTEKRNTNRKKQEGSKSGKQFVANTQAASNAHKSVVNKKPAVKKRAGNKSTANMPATVKKRAAKKR